MPKIHLFLDVDQVRSQVRVLAKSGLHAGIDLENSESLFGAAWDKDAREMGRRLRAEGMKALVRGPGSDLPLGALDPYVVDQVRACHDRAQAAAMHYGAKFYVVQMETFFGRARSERMARLEASMKMLRHLKNGATTRGAQLVVEPAPEYSRDMLDVLADEARVSDFGIMLSPARALLAGIEDVEALLESFENRLVALDITDRGTQDNEPRAPRAGVLRDVMALGSWIRRSGLEFCTLHMAPTETSAAIRALNALALESAPQVSQPALV